jgi:hypothetical protein
VRGLLCAACNSQLSQVDRGGRPPRPAEAEYLALTPQGVAA